jgi:hypothetical protein
MPEGIHYLLLLVVQLTIIGQVLPLATPADAKMLAEGIGPLFGIAMIFDHTGLHISSFFPENLQINHIAGNGILYKNNYIIHPGQRLSLCTNVFDEYLFQKR